MKVARADLTIPPVPQTGKNADAIRENLKRVKPPPGFEISLYAVVLGGRNFNRTARSGRVLKRACRMRPSGLDQASGAGVR
jgi:hypothetical protein